MNVHLNESDVRMGVVEETEAQIAVGLLPSTPEIHTYLTKMAQRARLELWIATEEMAAA